MVESTPVGRGALQRDDWLAVDALQKACRASDGFELPLERTPGKNGRVNQLTFRVDGTLVGVATLSSDAEVEVLSLVDSSFRRQGIGRKLLDAVSEECRSREVGSFLLVADDRFAGGTAFAAHMAGKLEFSEILMTLDWTEWRESKVDSTIQLELAGVRDMDELVSVRGENTEGARETVEAWLRHPANQIWIARKNRQAVGMIRLMSTPDVIWLNSFAVQNSLRGQGIGRAMLMRVLATLEQRPPVLLEVEADNEAALGLYRSAGFREQTRYRYFRVQVS